MAFEQLMAEAAKKQEKKKDKESGAGEKKKEKDNTSHHHHSHNPFASAKPPGEMPDAEAADSAHVAGQGANMKS